MFLKKNILIKKKKSVTTWSERRTNERRAVLYPVHTDRQNKYTKLIVVVSSTAISWVWRDDFCFLKENSEGKNPSVNKAH